MSDEENELLLNSSNENQQPNEDDLAQLLDGEDENNNNNTNNNDERDSSSDDDDDDDDDNNNNEDAAAPVDETQNHYQEHNNDDDDDDDALVATMSKKEAKKKLSKKEYKKWKKAQKKLKKKKGKKDKSSGGKKKGADAEKQKPKRNSKKQQGDYDDGENYGDDENMMMTAQGASRMTRGAAAAAKKQQQQAAKAKKGEIPVETLREEAGLVVLAMTDARKKDEAARKAGLPPLNRLGIKDIVVNSTRKVLLHEHLINAGLLDELTCWLADPQTKDLAPVDLRLVALHILDNLAYEGVQGGMRIATKHKAKIDKATGEMLDIDDLGYPGVSAENLQATKIGWAVNFVRRHPQESAENRTIATRLLEKFSRVFRGGDEEDRRDANSRQKVLWSTQSDNTILPPFEVQPSVTQRFIEASTKADPTDPLSYLGVRRAYHKPSYVTGLSSEGAARAMAGPRESTNKNSLNNPGSKKKRRVESKVNKKKNNKASLESDDEGSLADSGDEYDDDDEGFLAE